ncbi:hypothetical protein ABEB36_011679 [Hypothenemus hampei]|uniref:Uncharacterized protein n=1 Tax=Hypothenemus hampei TaxID=57062 RepID=A0ABD1E9E8_HYPHA
MNNYSSTSFHSDTADQPLDLSLNSPVNFNNTALISKRGGGPSKSKLQLSREKSFERLNKLTNADNVQNKPNPGQKVGLCSPMFSVKVQNGGCYIRDEISDSTRLVNEKHAIGPFKARHIKDI